MGLPVPWARRHWLRASCVALHTSPATLCRDREERKRKGARWTRRFGLGRTSTRRTGQRGGGSRAGVDRGIVVPNGRASAQLMRHWILALITAGFWSPARAAMDFVSSMPSLASFA
jgi:hypothetical protein